MCYYLSRYIIPGKHKWEERKRLRNSKFTRSPWYQVSTIDFSNPHRTIFQEALWPIATQDCLSRGEGKKVLPTTFQLPLAKGFPPSGLNFHTPLYCRYTIVQQVPRCLFISREPWGRRWEMWSFTWDWHCWLCSHESVETHTKLVITAAQEQNKYQVHKVQWAQKNSRCLLHWQRIRS